MNYLEKVHKLLREMCIPQMSGGIFHRYLLSRLLCVSINCKVLCWILKLSSKIVPPIPKMCLYYLLQLTLPWGPLYLICVQLPLLFQFCTNSIEFHPHFSLCVHLHSPIKKNKIMSFTGKWIGPKVINWKRKKKPDNERQIYWLAMYLDLKVGVWGS